MGWNRHQTPLISFSLSLLSSPLPYGAAGSHWAAKIEMDRIESRLESWWGSCGSLRLTDSRNHHRQLLRWCSEERKQDSHKYYYERERRWGKFRRERERSAGKEARYEGEVRTKLIELRLVIRREEKDQNEERENQTEEETRHRRLIKWTLGVKHSPLHLRMMY